MAIYYNEWDKKACAWLRELMADGLIPRGTIDDRSITDVCASDLRGYTQCHFFAGIGGWAGALRLAGYSQDTPVWTGSCPCQSFSCAGKQKGIEDPRHLWPAFFRLIRECRPHTVFGEQVEGAIGHGWLDGIQRDLEGESYAVGHCVLGAHSVGAPHIRQRLYWVANTVSGRRQAGSASQSGCEGRAALACDGGQKSGMADTSGRGQRTDGSAPGQSGHVEQREQGGGVGYSSEPGLERPFAELLPGGQAEGRLPTGPGDTGGMGDAEGQREGAESRVSKGAGTEPDGGSGVGEPNSPGPQPGSETTAPAGHGDTIESAGFWSNAIWHPCRDGKARRIPRAQSGIFGLSYGLPEGVDLGWLEGAFPLGPKVKGRVGLLKGYGNAIVPEVAAAFIQAAQEAIEATQT